jgi:hypothetical protein
MADTFKCQFCKNRHSVDELALGFLRPMHIYSIPKEEWEQRIQMSLDMCVIDDAMFLIRGVIEIPVTDVKTTFEWGVWAMLEKPDFIRYLELWSAHIDESKEPSMRGWLSGAPRFYPESNMAEMAIQLRNDGKRPLFILPENDPIGIEQRNGVTMERIHYFMDNFFPKSNQ